MGGSQPTSISSASMTPITTLRRQCITPPAHRKSNKTFYWGGCIEFSKTYIYTATRVEGPWKQAAKLDNCYYDAGLLVDDDDTMYVAYGNTTLNVAQLSPDGTQQIRTQPVFKAPPDVRVLEGSRFYKINGAYYIFTTRPPNVEYVLKSTCGPFGPYTIRPLVVEAASPVPGAGSPPRRGGGNAGGRLVLHGVHRRVSGRPNAGDGTDEVGR